ncbi:endolysin [Salmonella phage 18-India]|nr:endolysin [Salmonella phage 18-India]
MNVGQSVVTRICMAMVACNTLEVSQRLVLVHCPYPSEFQVAGS